MGRRRAGANLSVVRAAGFLLVVIGFFMPIFGRLGGSGFAIAGRLNFLFMGLLMYAVIVSAVIGLVVGILSMLSRRTKISPTVGWVALIVCIASGLVVFFSRYSGASLYTGGILILIGWIVALVGQFVSRSR